MNNSKKKSAATSSKLLTPCRSVGLTRKRKKLSLSPTPQNENNINSFNENSSGSQDTVEDIKESKVAQKLKNSKRKQKVNEEVPVQNFKISRKRGKINHEDIAEVPVIESNSGDEEGSTASLDNLKKSKKVGNFSTSAENLKSDPLEILHDFACTKNITDFNDNSSLRKNARKKQKVNKDVTVQKLKVSSKKGKIYNEDIVEIPLKESNHGNDQNSSLGYVEALKKVGNSSGSGENLESGTLEILQDFTNTDFNDNCSTISEKSKDAAPLVNWVESISLRKNSRKNQKVNEDVAVAVIESNQGDEENSTMGLDNVEELIFGNRENVETDPLEIFRDLSTHDFNDNSSTISEKSNDSEPLVNWKTRNREKKNVGEQKLLAEEEKDKESHKADMINLTPLTINIVRCDSLLEELKKSIPSLSTSQEYLDDEVANINNKNIDLELETVDLNKEKKEVIKKQSPVKRGRKKKVTETLETIEQVDFATKSIESLNSNISTYDDDEMLSDFSTVVKPRGRKSSNKVKMSKLSPKPNSKPPKKIKQTVMNTPIIGKEKTDSDDDFMEKVPRERITNEIEYIKKERVKIGENNSYTIVQRNNTISYIKSNDISSMAKTDDTVQQNTSSNIFIVDHKIHVQETTPSQAIDGIFDNSLPEEWKINKKPKEKQIDEKKQLLERKASMIKKVKDKHDKLERLKRISVYKKEHNLKDLQELALQIKRGLQEALVDLLCQLKDQQEKPYTMQSLLNYFSIPFELVGYNMDDDNFV